MRKSGLSAKVLALVAGGFGLVACEGAQGPQGEPGAPGSSCTVNGNTIDCGDGGSITIENGTNGTPGVSTATLSGTVTNTINQQGVAGVKVTLAPAPADVTVAPTDAAGAYSAANLPIGVYTVTFSATNYKTLSASVSLVAGTTVTVNAALVPTSSVFVKAAATPAAVDFNGTATLGATVTALDSSTPSAYQWRQIGGPAATISDPTIANPTVTVGDYEAQKAVLFEQAQVPEDRFQIVGISAYAFDEAQKATFEVTVTTGTGSYKATVAVEMPALQTAEATPVAYKFTTGLRNVPVDVPVLVCAPTTTGTWTATPAVALDGTDASKCRAFTPTTEGSTTLTFSDTGAGITKTLKIYAGNWLGGAITGIEADGSYKTCNNCHVKDATIEAMASWKNSGHAQIFRDNFNTPGHYSTACLECHTVGYDPDPNVNNNGIDDQNGFQTFLDTFTTDGAAFHSQPSNWTTLWTDTRFTAVAPMTNIQCDNCHGPGSFLSGAHKSTRDGSPDKTARVSMSSEVCGSCHGEPLRHGRYQQWQMSGHSNYELAVGEAALENRAVSATSAGPGHCGRCHSGQGFVAWVDAAQANGGDYSICLSANADGSFSGKCAGFDQAATRTYLTNLGLTADEVVPQTCQTCHDPHDVGTTTGEPSNAKVRVQGDTGKLAAGFYATGVGKGAVCMTCHNTRNGLHNDQFPPYKYTAGVVSGLDFTAPHAAAQADVLMGESAYFVDTGDRSPHSYIANTCVNCHMEQTDPPAQFSMNLSGTNHAFNASPTICAKCHSTGVQAADVQAATANALGDVGVAAGEVVRRTINSILANPNYAACQEYVLSSVTTAADDASCASCSGSNVVLTAAPASVEITGSIHGQGALALTFASPITFTSGTNTVSTNVVYVQPSSIKKHDLTVTGDATAGYTIACATTTVPAFVPGTMMDYGSAQTGSAGSYVAPTNPRLDVPGDVLAEAMWNYYLVGNDASGGVHNPGFVSKMLGGTYSQLSYFATNVLGSYK